MAKRVRWNQCQNSRWSFSSAIIGLHHEWAQGTAPFFCHTKVIYVRLCSRRGATGGIFVSFAGDNNGKISHITDLPSEMLRLSLQLLFVRRTVAISICIFTVNWAARRINDVTCDIAVIAGMPVQIRWLLCRFSPWQHRQVMRQSVKGQGNRAWPAALQR
ncbi:hypothetical protein [Phyllobacterium myrsinacearum]|uniref:Uncharacterized protein n=1 Tax=Phyllobacterium myrsinacearum TaxID=28101 RepID=A0A839ELN8_9HYPH|nr:hypothetical protein [Phyllobacterium myrsinacearum]MBA8877407.1 hypothetical protein [Phyllobacterium myrsinacearum]